MAQVYLYVEEQISQYTHKNKCSKNILIFHNTRSIISVKEFRTTVLTERRDIHMKITKDFIIEWVQRIPDEDEKFLRQIYTIIKKHLERKGKH